MKIFYVPTVRPGRSYRAIFQGLKNHPLVSLTYDSQDADFIFYSDQAFDGTSYPKDKLIFIDFSDEPTLTYDVDCLAYFKRSWVLTDKYLKRYQPSRPKHHYPISYMVMDEFIVDEEYERDIDFGCYLRPQSDPEKIEILNLATKVQCNKSFVGEINKSSRNVFDKEYLTTLKRTKITLSRNPIAWEGDSRTWEALASGTLLFVDKLETPMPYPLVDKEHLIYYDKSNLMDLLDYYLNNNEERIRIAKNGFDHVMKYHRTVNRIDYILRTIRIII